MRLPLIVGLIILLLLLPWPVFSQTKTVLKSVPIKDMPADSGARMFAAYCAACHGSMAKGDGPAVPALKHPPGDMTLLARINGGKFPALKVQNIISGRAEVVAHGTSEMPVWGDLFRSLSPGDNAQVQQRIHNLVKYIEFLQVR